MITHYNYWNILFYVSVTAIIRNIIYIMHNTTYDVRCHNIRCYNHHVLRTTFITGLDLEDISFVPRTESQVLPEKN